MKKIISLILSFVLISSANAFAVSIAKGMTIKKHLLLRYAFILAFFFGLFSGFDAFVRMVGRQLFSGVNFCI